VAAPSSKHNKHPEEKIEMRSRLKYNLENNMSIEKIGKGFEGNKDQIKQNIMKILQIFILMIVSNSTDCSSVERINLRLKMRRRYQIHQFFKKIYRRRK
jgi:hypothetical protein